MCLVETSKSANQLLLRSVNIIELQTNSVPGTVKKTIEQNRMGLMLFRDAFGTE